MAISPESAFPFFFVGWIALGLGSWLYIRSRPNAAAKRRAHQLLTVISGMIFTGFAIWMIPPAAIIMVPAVVLITWLNLRNTHFCDHCGKMVVAQPFQRVAFCPRCGARLQAKGLT